MYLCESDREQTAGQCLIHPSCGPSSVNRPVSRRPPPHPGGLGTAAGAEIWMAGACPASSAWWFIWRCSPLKARSELCPQCKHWSKPLSFEADMLAGALLSLWRLTKVHAGKEGWLYQSSETNGLKLITPLQATYDMVSFRINNISESFSSKYSYIRICEHHFILNLGASINCFLFSCNMKSPKNSNTPAQ